MDAYQAELAESYPISSALKSLLEQAIPAQILYDAALKAYHRVGQEMQEMRGAAEDLAKVVRQIGADDNNNDDFFANTKAVQLSGHVVREHCAFVAQLRSLQAEHIELWYDLHYLYRAAQAQPRPQPQDIDTSTWSKGVDESYNCTRVCQKGRYRIQVPSPRERVERGRDMRPWYPDLGYRTMKAEEEYAAEREG